MLQCWARRPRRKAPAVRQRSPRGTPRGWAFFAGSGAGRALSAGGGSGSAAGDGGGRVGASTTRGDGVGAASHSAKSRRCRAPSAMSRYSVPAVSNNAPSRVAKTGAPPMRKASLCMA